MSETGAGNNDHFDEESKLILKPFSHQVSGHFPMICLDSRQFKFRDQISSNCHDQFSLLCKPLDAQEHEFYKTADEKLRKYMPKFIGSVEVNFEAEDEDKLRFTSDKSSFMNLINQANVRPSTKSQFIANQNVIPCQEDAQTNCSIYEEGNSERNADCHHCSDITSEYSDDGNEEKNIFSNPWALRCLKNFLKRNNIKMSTGGATCQVDSEDASTRRPSTPEPSFVSGQSSTPNKKMKKTKMSYLLIENLVPYSTYKYPCILDLKIGPRQHSDDCSEAKRGRKIQKSLNTTSSVSGLRLSGMQIYEDGDYVCFDKLDGRKMSCDQLESTIKRFCKPICEISALYDTLVQNLEELKFCVEKLDGYRFYTCSILIVYDQHKTRCVKVKFIDFAHSTSGAMRNFFDASQKPIVEYEGPDDGVLFGLSNLINILT